MHQARRVQNLQSIGADRPMNRLATSGNDYDLRLRRYQPVNRPFPFRRFYADEGARTKSTSIVFWRDEIKMTHHANGGNRIQRIDRIQRRAKCKRKKRNGMKTALCATVEPEHQLGFGRLCCRGPYPSGFGGARR